jgi:hypothetical protein
MGFWPFGKDPANIEIATRVITAAAQNGVRVRGKLTIHFAEPQRQVDADAAADRCSSAAVALLREAPDHGRLIGAETQLTAQLFARYPHEIAPARGVELAALHVLGDPALSDELRRASTTTGPMAPITGPMAPIGSASAPPPRSTPPPPNAPAPRPPSIAPVSRNAPPARSSAPPPPRSFSPPPMAIPVSSPPPGSSGQAPPRRRGSSQIRSIQSLLMPPGTPPAAMGSFVSPSVRDSSARLLIGFFRAHDLVTLRKVTVDDSSAEALAALVPVSDAPPGGYEASRAVEIARWQGTLGAEVVSALHRETNAVTLYLARDALLRNDVTRALAIAVTDAAGAAAFTGDEAIPPEPGHYPDPQSPEFAEAVAQELAAIASAGDDPEAMTSALRPLLGMLQEDLNMMAMIVKMSSG